MDLTFILFYNSISSISMSIFSPSHHLLSFFFVHQTISIWILIDTLKDIYYSYFICCILFLGPNHLFYIRHSFLTVEKWIVSIFMRFWISFLNNGHFFVKIIWLRLPIQECFTIRNWLIMGADELAHDRLSVPAWKRWFSDKILDRSNTCPIIKRSSTWHLDFCCNIVKMNHRLVYIEEVSCSSFPGLLQLVP